MNYLQEMREKKLSI